MVMYMYNIIRMNNKGGGGGGKGAGALVGGGGAVGREEKAGRQSRRAGRCRGLAADF